MDVSVKDAGDFVIYLGAICLAIGALASVIHFLIIRPLKKWVTELVSSKISQPLDKVKNEVTHNGGSSMKDYVRDTAEQLKQLDLKVNLLAERFDRHLETHSWRKGQ